MTRTGHRQETPYASVPGLPDQGNVDLLDLTGSGENSVELEIGFGKGRFLLDRAAGLPGTRFLGLETRRKWVHLVASRIGKRRLDNVLVLNGDARRALPRMVPDAALQNVFINFPDPWWKARHEKRMVVCPELLTEVARLLVDRGSVFVQTDVDFRKDAYKALLLETPDLAPAEGDGEIGENPFESRSLREIRCIETRLPVYRLLFCRRAR